MRSSEYLNRSEEVRKETLGFYRHVYDWQLLDSERQGDNFIKGSKADIEGGTMISRQDRTSDGKIKLTVQFDHPITRLTGMKEITRDREFTYEEEKEVADEILDAALEKKK